MKKDNDELKALLGMALETVKAVTLRLDAAARRLTAHQTITVNVHTDSGQLRGMEARIMATLQEQEAALDTGIEAITTSITDMKTRVETLKTDLTAQIADLKAQLESPAISLEDELASIDALNTTITEFQPTPPVEPPVG